MKKEQKYELLYIVPNTFTEQEVKKINEEVEKIITDNKGKNIVSSALGKQKLAYKIQNFNHGYYNLINFTDNKDLNLEEINNLLKFSNKIIRFLLIKKNEERNIKIDPAKKRQSGAKKEEREEEKTAKEKTIKEGIKRKKEVKKDVNLEDLDKKINDILDTKDLL